MCYKFPHSPEKYLWSVMFMYDALQANHTLNCGNWFTREGIHIPWGPFVHLSIDMHGDRCNIIELGSLTSILYYETITKNINWGGGGGGGRVQSSGHLPIHHKGSNSWYMKTLILFDKTMSNSPIVYKWMLFNSHKMKINSSTVYNKFKKSFV